MYTMDLRRFLLPLALLGLLNACQTPDSSPASSSADSAKKDDEVVMAILYQQRAAEYKALCLQSYNLARTRIEQVINDPKAYTKKGFAVVTDLDETALDNSPNEAWLYLHDSAFTQAEFDDWTVHGHPGAVPGSIGFFQYVDRLKDKKGRKITIYYVSNRTSKPEVITATKNAMKDLNFPQLIDSQFLFRASGAPNSKEARRQQIST